MSHGNDPFNTFLLNRDIRHEKNSGATSGLHGQGLDRFVSGTSFIKLLSIKLNSFLPPNHTNFNS